MNNTIVELTEKIVWLEKLYNQTLSNLNSNISNFLTITLGILGLTGVGLIFIVRQLIAIGIEKGIKETKGLYDDKFSVLEKRYLEEIEANKSEFTLTINKLRRETVDKDSGIWTPYLIGDDYDYLINEGKYYRNGNIITLWMKIKLKHKDDTPYNEVYIHGLPYVAEKIINCDITLADSNLDQYNIRLFVDNLNMKSNILTYVALCDVYGKRIQKTWIKDSSEIIGSITYIIKTD